MLSIIIFGGTGDLARKKLFRSLYNLYSKNILPPNVKIIGFARRDLNTESYRQFVSDELIGDFELRSEFLQTFYYFQGDLGTESSYHDLKTFLSELDDQYGVCASKLFYLSIRPELYDGVFDLLKKTQLLNTCTSDSTAWSRLLIEKPFGTNFEHAKFLDTKLSTVASEDQIFRIDHYLAKEALENILVFRFKNEIFRNAWNASFVSRIKIHMYETRGIDGRGEFYDEVGALRDVGQNHALQMLALILMNEPENFDGVHIRKNREDVLKTLTPAVCNEQNFERAQYVGYEDIITKSSSQTETFFKITLNTSMSQWNNVPFIIESGKKMAHDDTSIHVEFIDGSKIVFEISPIPRITFSFHVKESGYDYKTASRDLAFSYQENNMLVLDAYEKILYQAIAGDVTSFVTTHEVLEQWRIIDTILQQWTDLPLRKY